MSTETEFIEAVSGRKGSAWKVVLSAAAGMTVLFGGFQTAVTMPMRLDGHDKRLESMDARFEALKAAAQSDREILIRIEEQVRQLRDEMRPQFGKQREP